MPVHPDDLPRSPTGRLPQWVLDEAHGLPHEPPGWRTASPPPPAPPGRRRGSTRAVGIVALGVLAGAWWMTDGASVLPGDLAGALPGAAVGVADLPAAVPAPSAEVVALADAAHLSEEGRRLLYGARPEILGEQAFAGRCGDAEGVGGGHGGGAVGCYQGATNTIVVYAPADPRLRASVVQTAAHETLHAAWLRLTTAEQAELTPLLEAEVASVAADDPIHGQIAGSVGSHPESRPTELFAYVGTQLWRDGGLAPQLEAVYARFVLDRAALVAVSTGLQAMLDAMSADIHATWQAVAAQESAAARDRLQHTGDVASVAFYQRTYEARVAEVAAMPIEQRQWLRLSWVWWDDTPLPMAPADETLAAAAALLARDHADLTARDAAITAAEAASAAERTRVQALVADLEALHGQLVPGAPAG